MIDIIENMDLVDSFLIYFSVLALFAIAIKKYAEKRDDE